MLRDIVFFLRLSISPQAEHLPKLARCSLHCDQHLQSRWSADSDSAGSCCKWHRREKEAT